MLERRTKVAQLRMRRVAENDIARAVGCPVGTVHSDIRAIERYWEKRFDRETVQLRAEVAAGLDDDEKRLRVHMMALFSKQSIEAGCRVFDRILAIIDRRIQMFGLANPGITDMLRQGGTNRIAFVAATFEREGPRAVPEDLSGSGPETGEPAPDDPPVAVEEPQADHRRQNPG